MADFQPTLFDVDPQSGPLPGMTIVGPVGFTGDTHVSLMNGTEASLSELIAVDLHVKLWVYSCNRYGSIEPGRLRLPRIIGRDRPIVKVTLDNGEVIRCDERQPFLLRNLTTKAADELILGESLMPLYRRLCDKHPMKGYEEFLNPANRKWYFTHRMSVWATRGHYQGVVHHKNLNKRDNSPNNLEVMTWEEHTKLHSDMDNGFLVAYARSEIGRRKSREMMMRNWADPEWRRKASVIAPGRARRTALRLAAEGRCGTQAMDKERLSALGREFGSKNIRLAHNPASMAKRVATLKKRWEDDPDELARRIRIARENIAKAVGLPVTEAQRSARRMNALRLIYRKYKYTEYETFEDYIKARETEPPKPKNHQVVSVEPDGREDVYGFDVDVHRNFALSAGVFVVA